MLLKDQKELDPFVISATTLVEELAMPDDAAEAEVESRKMLLVDAEMSSLAAANSNRGQVLTLLGGPGPMLSSGGEDAKHNGKGAAPGLTAEGKKTGPSKNCGTLFSTKRDIQRMKQIIIEYVEGLPNEVTKLLESMNLRDLQPLRRVAHQLRGSGGGYGFDAISELAGNVEDSIVAGDTLAMIRIRVLCLVDAICRVEGYDDSNM